ncbi:MAG: hypothetical protein ABI954_03535 [Pyrinomonadaceae bacterium]
MRNLLTILVVACGIFVSSTAAQQAPKSLPGEVIAIDTTNNQLKLKTNSGEATVSLDTKTEFKRLSPDKLSEPNSATPSSLSEISIGDKIVAVGILSDDKKTVTQTRRIFLLTKADIAKKQEADAARWTVRGIAGKVTVLNPATNTITIATRGGMQRTIIVTANDKTVFHRYAPNSVKFSDAKVSNFTELKVGDQLRAVGEKSADNTGLTAEEILFGSFRTVAGKVTAIDAVKGEIIVKDLQTGKDVTISVNSETLLRRFPPEMAQRMAQMQVMRASGGMGGGQNPAGGVTGERTPNGAGQPTPRPNGQAGQMMPPNGVPPGAGGMGGGQGMRRGDVDSMLEQMPALALTELKIGDAVAASSSVGQTPERVTAIKFVAGIEPFLITPQPSGMPTGNRPQSSPSINIPGLDGIGAP